MFFYGFETRGRGQGVAIRPLPLPRGPNPFDPQRLLYVQMSDGI